MTRSSLLVESSLQMEQEKHIRRAADCMLTASVPLQSTKFRNSVMQPNGMRAPMRQAFCS